MHRGGIRDDGGGAAAGDDCAEVSVYAGAGGGGYAVFQHHAAAEIRPTDAGASARGLAAVRLDLAVGESARLGRRPLQRREKPRRTGQAPPLQEEKNGRRRRGLEAGWVLGYYVEGAF